MTEIEKYEGPPPAKHRQWIELLAPAAELAANVAETEFVPAPLRKRPAAIAAVILYGDELGLSPMQSLAKVCIVEGRPALYAEAQRALVLAAGHEIWLSSANTTSVTWCGRRKGAAPDAVTSITWTMDDARRAGLDGRQNYRKYPRAMLSARASAELCKAMFADVLGGMPAVEELEGGDADVPTPDDPGDVGEPTPPEGKKVRRSDKAKKAAKNPPAKRARGGAVSGPALPAASTSAAAPAPAAEPTEGPALPGAATAPSRSGGTTAPDGDDPPAGDETAAADSDGDGGGLPWPNYYAMRCSEHGLDDDDRHALTLLLTEGRTSRSGEMTPADREFARTTLDKLKQGTRRVRFVDDAAGGGE